MLNKLTKVYKFFPIRRSLASIGKNSRIEFPTYVAEPSALHIEENTLIRKYAKIQNAPNEKITIKKYTVIGMSCTIVSNSHRSTVGIPQILLGSSHINDISNDLTIGEDVWIGVNVTILANANIGRGAICGACSVVTKPVPPYALVVGSPARIVGVKFTIDQILEHEEKLYPQDERMSRAELESLFEKYYKDKKVFGIKTYFTEEEFKKIEEAKKKRNFIEISL